jgi:hypothetical protein
MWQNCRYYKGSEKGDIHVALEKLGQVHRIPSEARRKEYALVE